MARIVILLLALGGLAYGQTSPGFIDGAALCANYPNPVCQGQTPTNPLSLNQAFMNKLDVAGGGGFPITFVNPVVGATDIFVTTGDPVFNQFPNYMAPTLSSSVAVNGSIGGLVVVPKFGAMTNNALFYQMYATSIGTMSGYIPIGTFGQLSSYESTVWTSARCGMVCGNDSTAWKGDSSHSFGSSIIMNNGDIFDVMDAVVFIDCPGTWGGAGPGANGNPTQCTPATPGWPGFTTGINMDFIRSVPRSGTSMTGGTPGSVTGIILSATGAFTGDTAIVVRPAQWEFAFDAGGIPIKNAGLISFSQLGTKTNPIPPLTPYEIVGFGTDGLKLIGGCVPASCTPQLQFYTSTTGGMTGNFFWYNNSTDDIVMASLGPNGFFDFQALSTNGPVVSLLNTAAQAGGVGGAAIRFTSAANFGIFVGSGVPTASANKGSLYLRTDGTSASTRMYVNTDGGGTWTNVVTGF